jgi:NADH-quinone oxidoreductase subunit E
MKKDATMLSSVLSNDEKKEISEEFGRYEQKSAACIEALRVVQRHRGWVSDEAILGIARFLGMSPADVDGVATFYNLIFRKPVGRHILFVCDSVSCWVMGCDKVKQRLNERLGISLGETTQDRAFTILPIACLGHCENAPVVLVDGNPLIHADTVALDNCLTGLRNQDDMDERKA